MRCPICEENVWKTEYRPDVNLISYHCINCDVTTIEIDIAELYEQWRLNKPQL